MKKFDYFPVFSADADMWEEDGLSVEDEDALILALWRFYRGRPSPEGLSIFAKLIYSPIVKRWEAEKKNNSKRSLAGKLGGLKTQEQNRLAKANAKANGLAYDKANASSKTQSTFAKALDKPTTTTTTTSTSNLFLKEKDKKEKPIERTIPPKIEWCNDYAQEAGLNMKVEEFFDHFASNGWKVGGKTPMKDWKAAMRNWARRDFGSPKKDGARSQIQPMPQAHFRDDYVVRDMEEIKL